jgi:hypothetical protein
MEAILAGIGFTLLVGIAGIGALAAVVLVAVVVSNGCKDYDLSEEEDLCDDGLPSWGGPLSEDYYDWEYGSGLPDSCGEGQTNPGEGDSEADSGLVETVRPGALAAEQRVGVRGPTDDSAGS